MCDTVARVDLRAELGLALDQLLAGFLGRLDQSKDMDNFMSAFRAFAPRDAVLALLGEGKEMAALESSASGSLKMFASRLATIVPIDGVLAMGEAIRGKRTGKSG